ncbi:AlpA family phage regulatory protein [Nonomuraea sp. NN258]|nr:AlpA family phage regulatory protein [Nonomuraea antri]
MVSRLVVAERCGVSVRTLERWAELGIGPRPIRLGPRLIRYRHAEVEAWLSSGADGEVSA